MKKGRGRPPGKGRGRGKVEATRDNFAAVSYLYIDPPDEPMHDQSLQLQEQPNQQVDKSQPEMTRSARGRGGRGGKGCGRGKVEARRDNYAVASSLNINLQQGDTVDQTPVESMSHFIDNQLPEPNRLIDRFQAEMVRLAQGRGQLGGKSHGRGKVEAIRDNFAVGSSLNINSSQGHTLDQAPQPQGPTLDQAFLDLMSHFIDNLPVPDQQMNEVQPEMARSAPGRGRQGGKGREHGNVEGTRDNYAVASSLNISPPQRPMPGQPSQPQARPTRMLENLRSRDASQGSYSGSELSRNLEGSAHPSLENLNSGAVFCNNTRKGRGKYKSVNVEKQTRFGNKIIVDIPDDIDRAVGPGARDIVNYCGLIMRSTISFKDGEFAWAKLFEKHGLEMWLKVKEKFAVGGGKGEHVLQGFVKSTMQRLYRTWKTRLHAEYSRYSTDEERLSHPPDDVMPEDWKFLVQYFGSEAFKARSEKNKINRQKQTTKHSCGSKSFAEVEEDAKDPLTGEKASPDRVWELQHTHKNDKGELVWSDPQAQVIHGQIKELVAKQQNEQSENRMSGDEILATVLGERTCYVPGKGYGKKPRKRYHMQLPNFEFSLSSAIKNVRQEMQADMDQKLQEEREQMRAEMDRRFQDQMEEERRKMQAEMDRRMIDNMATLMFRIQQQLGQSPSTPLAIQGNTPQSGEVSSWGSKRKRKW